MPFSRGHANSKTSCRDGLSSTCSERNIRKNAKFIDAIVTELNQLGEQKHKPLAETSGRINLAFILVFNKSPQLASKPDLIVQHIGVYVYQSETEKRPEPLINCAFHTHIFKPIVPILK